MSGSEECSDAESSSTGLRSLEYRSIGGREKRVIRRRKETSYLGSVTCAGDQLGLVFGSRRKWRWGYEGWEVEEEVETVALVMAC